MKSGKMIILYSAIIFIVAGIIGFNLVCSITNFNVDYQLASKQAIKSAESLQEKLDVYLNENLVFFDENKIEPIFDEFEYLELVSVKKIYPNQLALVVKEKTETYAIKTNSGYAMLDVDGRIISEREVNENNIDSVANILIEIQLFNTVEESEGTEVVFTNKVSFDSFNIDDNVCSLDNRYTDCLSNLFEFTSILDVAFDGIRSNIKAATIYKHENLNLYYYSFITTEGVSLEVDVPSFISLDGTQENDKDYLKTIAPIVNDYYVSLADADKLYGRIVVEPKLNTEGLYNYQRGEEEKCYTISYTPREPIIA